MINVSRGLLLSKLNEAAVGLSSKELLEQSNAFVFTGGRLYTFNDDVMVSMRSPVDFDSDVVVNATTFMGILSKMPDDTVRLSMKNGVLKVRGESDKRTARITCFTEVALPVKSVPRPGAWVKLGNGVNTAMQQAAKTCGNDQTQFVNTCVHVTPDHVEGCDNDRFLRVLVKTGFPQNVLIPASSVNELESLDLSKVSVGNKWCHFKTASGAEISVRCSHERYPDGMDELLVMKAPVKIVLPSTMKDIIERAEVFHSAEYSDKVGVSVMPRTKNAKSGTLTITSAKDDGEYTETEPMDYDGRELTFNIQPRFLAEILHRTRDVKVDDRKMKVSHNGIQFVVSLMAKPKDKNGEE